MKRYTDPSSLRKHVKTYKHNEPQLSNISFTSDESTRSCEYDGPDDDADLIIDVVSLDRDSRDGPNYHQKQQPTLSLSPYEQVLCSENYFGTKVSLSPIQSNFCANFLQNSTNFMKMYDENSFPRETIKFENMEIDVPLDLRMHHR
jgi:hypothetical protein